MISILDIKTWSTYPGVNVLETCKTSQKGTTGEFFFSNFILNQTVSQKLSFHLISTNSLIFFG